LDTGLKFYCLADQEFYLYDFWLYQGEESRRNHSPTGIVLDFADAIIKESPGLSYIWVADSFYGSLNLAEELHSRNQGCLLSCRSDRPSFLFNNFLGNKLEKKHWASIDCQKFSAITVHDKAKVNLLSNLMKTWTPLQHPKTGTSLPQGLYYYRKWLGGLDHFDGQLHLYLNSHRHIKWTQALLGALLKIAVNNTWVIRRQFIEDLDLKTVIKEIIIHLAQQHTVRKDNNRPASLKRYDGLNHWIESGSNKDCVQCLKGDKRSKTTYKCSKCNVPLHALCMQLYHEK
jgi:hypothetical protein